MHNVIYVAAGGALGAALRYLAGVGAIRLLGFGFPYGTLFVNIAGSLLMGVFVGYMARHNAAGGQGLHLFVAIGLLGGFTTFSSFSLDAVSLFQRGEAAQAAFYIMVSVAVSIAALMAGLWAVR